MSEATGIVENYLTTAMTECTEDSEKVESLTKVLLFVHNEVSEASNSGGTATVRDFLAKMIKESHKGILDAYLNQLIIDIEKGKHSDMYAQMMQDFYQRFVFEVPADKKALKKYESSDLKDKAVNGVIAVIQKLPSEHVQIITRVLQAGAKRGATVPMAIPGKVVQRVGFGTIAAVGLVAAQLGYVVIKNMVLWWNGKISGKRCAKNILDSSAAAIGAGAGGFAGAAIGTIAGAPAGPVGIIAGGVVGGVVGATGLGFIGNKVMKKITKSIFDLPKTAAEENAYKYMGVSRHAANDDINRMYHKKALATHPDRGGNTEAFNELQIQLQIIRLARGLDQ